MNNTTSKLNDIKINSLMLETPTMTKTNETNSMINLNFS